MSTHSDSPTTSAREAILQRIWEANHAAATSSQPTASVGAPAHPLPPVSEPTPATGELLELFIERTEDYRAVVETATRATAAQTIAAACATAHGVIVPDGLDPIYTADLPADLVRTDPGAAAELDRIEGVVTTSAASIAETGTIVLDHSAGQGRRAVSLVPDLHVCVVPASTIHRTVPQAMSALRSSVEAGRALTWISGPSATSDIELERVEGVHGPRRLHVVVVTDA